MAAGGNAGSGTKKKGKKQQQVEEAAAAAAATGGSANTPAQPSASQQLFGKWTGKTPVTLLNEHVQRNAGWQRPDYNMRGSSSSSGGGSGFHCVVRMTKVDAKSSNSKAGPSTETVVFEPTETKSRPLRHATALEARHTAATYALHRLRSATSMHLMLPPMFRAYWLELEEQRKELQLTNKKKEKGANDPADWKYAADPFAAKAARTKEREVKEEERTRTRERERRAVALGRSEDLMRPGMRRRWEELAEVHMSEDNRQTVEAVVRTWTRSWALDEEEEGGKQKKTNNMKEEEPGARNKLLALGFRRAHVAEALTHAGTMQEALDWLCVHIPEDDLPDQVLRRSYRAAPAVVAPSAPDADGSADGERTAAAVGAAAKRLARSGFAESACKEAVAECLALAPTAAAAEAMAAFRLHRQLCGRAAESGTAAESAQLREAVAEEIEALEAIYAGEDRVERLSGNEVHRVSVALRPETSGADGGNGGDAVRVPTDARLEFWFPPRLDYPHTQTPAITVASAQLPAYLKQHVARKLDALVKCDGLPVMFEAVSAVDSALQTWLSAPPLLAELYPRKTKLPAQPQQQPKQQASSRSTPARRQPAPPPSPASVLPPPDTPAYRALQRERAQLPAARMERQIAELVAGNTCTVIAGATGCGKTTQVPQFILDHGLRQGRHVSIICTQPRRISAVGVATRVAAERGDSGGECGGAVGYAVRGETRRSAATRLLFCTTGVLLQMLRDARGLDGVTHVVCDEVHERSVDSDLALALLRAAVQGNRSGLRVVLMSATAQGDSFARYFGASTPVVAIPGRTFPVADVYLEDFTQEAGGSKPGSGSASALSIDYAMACRVVEHIHASAPLERAVLVFMPGAAEIRSCIGALSRSNCADALHVLPLHSALAAGEQRRVFGAPPRGMRKVVVATNVAETGITVADIGFVVDAGRARVVRFDHRTRIARLVTVFCSQAAATQRRGRAGRVREGVCYRLYTRETEQQLMPPHEDPEIRRAPLEQACLRAKAVGYSDAAALLAQMLDPPESAAVDSAQTLLVAVGACDAPRGQLTALGRLMAQLPLDLRLAKMLVVGALLGALDAALPLVALMSLDRPLVASGSMSATASLSRDSNDLRTHCAPPLARSDWIADLAVYLSCASSNSKGDGSSNGSTNLPPGVSAAAMREVKRSIRTLRQSIEQTGLVSAKKNQMHRPNHSISSGLDDIMVLKAIILAALSPNIARVRLPPQKYQEMITGTVGVAHQARELAFYAPADPFAHVSSGAASAGVWATHDKRTDQRLFIHPQSTMFAEPKYPVPFITYLSLSSVESAPTCANNGSGSTSNKVYIRDVTVPGIYALLLLGPPLTVDHDNRVVSIGGSGALAVRAWPRIAVLVNRLRKLMDELLRRKLDDPGSVSLESHPVIGAVLQLIRSDGQQLQV